MLRRTIAVLMFFVLAEVALAALLAHVTSPKVVAIVVGIPSLIGGAMFIYACIACWRRAVDQLAVGSLIEEPRALDLVILVGSLLLLLPGLLTDLLGFVILATPLRRHAGSWLKDRMVNMRKPG